MSARDDLRNLMDVMLGAVSGASATDMVTRLQAAVTAVEQYFGLKHSKLLETSPIPDFQLTMVIRAMIIDHIDSARRVRLIGLSNGYLLPDDPFSTIEEMNMRRKLFDPVTVDNTTAGLLLSSASKLIAVANEYDSGDLTFERSGGGAQMESYSISVDGMSTQSGDPLADILGYQPDGDYIKRKRALDALARLDFSKRKPYLLFISDYDVPRKRSGAVICWGKMRDAAGYTLTRRDTLFPESDELQRKFTNAEIEAETNRLRSNVAFMGAISFYDWLKPGDYVAWIDDTIRSDRLYSYTVNGYQLRAQASIKLFDIPTRNLYVTAAQLKSIMEIDPNSSQSPYPRLSEIIFGDRKYDWILAGCNVTASIRAGNGTERLIGYIGSSIEALVELIRDGRFVAPIDIGEFERSVDTAIASYGVSQVLLTVMDGTGMTLFIAGKDDPLGIRPTVQSIQLATGGLAKIISAIDPETATADPRTLLTGMSVGLQPAMSFSNAGASVDTFELEDSSLIDLTTFEGIGRLIRLIREFYDFHPASLI